MSRHNELIFTLAAGIDASRPPIVVGEQGSTLPLTVAANVRVSDNSLRTPFELTNLLAGSNNGGQFQNIEAYTSLSFNSLWLYIIGANISLARVAAGSSTNLTLEHISSAGYTSGVATAAWDDRVFVATHQAPVFTLRGAARQNLDFGQFGTVHAKHVLVADDRVFFGNLIQNGSLRPARAIWSDLYSPSNFTVNETSEAGSFDVGVAQSEITGLSSRRGIIHFYTRNNIVTARYVGIQEGTFLFDVLVNGVGNLYHYALVSGKEADFFIGRDNFYLLEGSTPAPIGEPIWNVWNSVRKFPKEQSVRGFFFEQQDEVYWQFIANGQYGTVDGQLWEVVYNYKLNQWTMRQSETLDFWQYDYYLGTSDTWLETVGTWSAQSGSWLSSLKELTESEFFITANGLHKLDKTKHQLISGPRSFSVETYDIVISSVFGVKLIDSLKLIYEGTNIFSTAAKAANHDLRVSVGIRTGLDKQITWGTPVACDEPNDAIFYFSKRFQGNLVRFRFTWTNTNSYNVTRLAGFAIRYIDTINNATDR